ncbi:hypothetical protein [Mycobacterium intracellulare]|uniref:hypothetical protein n=1 Tax=Mycobacterium intracellulare TaxID=1767 RepID=UPI0034D76BCC
MVVATSRTTPLTTTRKLDPKNRAYEMAYIRSFDTKQRYKGKAVKRYEVVWREPATDASGLPNGKMRSRQESYPTRHAAEARRDELNNSKHSGGTSALAQQRKAGMLTFGHYAAAWL